MSGLMNREIKMNSSDCMTSKAGPGARRLPWLSSDGLQMTETDVPAHDGHLTSQGPLILGTGCFHP